ncbi:MAG: YjcZ family sporulation protein [Paenibacillaceae bacterium]
MGAVGGAFTNTGTILVLYILLVIVLMAGFCI